MKTNVIKLQFINNGVARGKEYTYFSDTEVEVGETVNIDGKKQGIITQVNVPLAEIEQFKDRAKTIVGKFEIKLNDRVEVKNTKGEYAGNGTVVNINDLREPDLRYGVNADFYDGDLLFVGENQLKVIQEVIENVK